MSFAASVPSLRLRGVITVAMVCVGTAAVAPAAPAAGGTFIGPLNRMDTVASTVPASGDVNPYGVAVARVTAGRLVAGNVLVSNFNDRANKQGTGKTIVEISPRGHLRLFASLDPGKLPGSCPGGIGLTTALVSLRSGWVIVGSLPTKNGTSSTMRAGCLLVISPSGRVAETISGTPINGPWDMTAVDQGRRATLFITNVLNGTVSASPKVAHRGTVVRIGLSLRHAAVPAVTSEVVIGQGFPERTDPAALVVGPTGVGLSHGTLFVANSAANAVTAINNAMTRRTASRGTTITHAGAVNDPLGLAIAPNGHILTTNGGDGNLVETTAGGRQLTVKTLNNTPAPPGPPGNGTLFGLAVSPGGTGVYFVDDGSNTLRLLH